MLQIFLATLLGGGVFMLLPPFKPHIFKIILAFTGSYLFALTVLHLLPDLFKAPTHSHRIGLFILAGFFLQIVLLFQLDHPNPFCQENQEHLVLNTI